jgi:CBS domain-containing protein
VLNEFKFTLIKPRLEAWIDQHPGATQSKVTAKANALMQIEFDEFSQEELDAAHCALIAEDLIRRGTEPEIASDMAKTMYGYTLSGDIAGLAKYLTESNRTRSTGEIIYGPWKKPDTHTDKVTTFRVRGLSAANKPLVSVKQNDSIKKAIILMQLNNCSQIPVMDSERDVKGVVSWQSIVTMGMNLRGEAREYMEKASEIDADTSLLETIDAVVRHQYVLVRQKDRKISGIVTNSDLSSELRQRSEPFILINQIENHIRYLISENFTDQEISKNSDSRDTRDGKQANSVFDLTFNGYIQFLRYDENWMKLKQNTDKQTFIINLEKIRDIRNDIMHFNPDKIAPESLELLRRFLKLLEVLEPKAWSPKAAC